MISCLEFEICNVEPWYSEAGWEEARVYLRHSYHHYIYQKINPIPLSAVFSQEDAFGTCLLCSELAVNQLMSPRSRRPSSGVLLNLRDFKSTFFSFQSPISQWFMCRYGIQSLDCRFRLLAHCLESINVHFSLCRRIIKLLSLEKTFVIIECSH